ncbi:MAG: hypothetical protein IPF46_02545 [Saprospiraceae bacterium]|nr:hypothetical protein [Candidatus Vicinibacter affinis]
MMLITALLSLFYMKEALFNRRPDENFLKIKEALGLGSIFVCYLLYKAYQVGEQQGKFGQGLVYILGSWLCWLVIIGVIFIISKFLQ